MTWRYSLIQKSNGKTDWVELHEIYTDEGCDKHRSRTAEPILVANDIDDMLGTLSLMKVSIRKYGVEDDLPECEEARALLREAQATLPENEVGLH